MFPELLTRTDLDIFLPPIGGLTAYIFGDPAAIADPNKKLAVRVHDECNGSDVLGVIFVLAVHTWFMVLKCALKWLKQAAVA